MKKVLISLIVLSLTFSLTACFKKQVDESEVAIDGVPETGRVLDISDKIGQTATVTPGDILYLKLTGESDSDKEWSVVAPTTGDYLKLKDHKVIGLTDPKILDGQFTNEWWLKIEAEGIFDMQFDYGVAGQKVEDSFEIKIISE